MKRLNSLLLLLSAMVIAGCASEYVETESDRRLREATRSYIESRYGNRPPMIVSANERTIVVKRGIPNDYSLMQSIVDAECRKYNRIGQLVARPNERTDHYVYSCER